MNPYVYTLRIKGWGDSEDEFYSFGCFSTMEKAKARLEEHLADWEEDGNDRADVDWLIDADPLDV